MGKKIKIILCDDDEFMGKMFSQKLELEGFVVTWIKDGKEAFTAICKEKPDLAILDLITPTMTGFEILKAIYESDDEELKQIPMIVSSNLAQEKDISEVKRLGAVEFVIKSRILPKELVEKVRTHLPKKIITQ